MQDWEKSDSFTGRADAEPAVFVFGLSLTVVTGWLEEGPAAVVVGSGN
jgi:hypothetical protein